MRSPEQVCSSALRAALLGPDACPCLPFRCTAIDKYNVVGTAPGKPNIVIASDPVRFPDGRVRWPSVPMVQRLSCPDLVLHPCMLPPCAGLPQLLLLCGHLLSASNASA